MLGAAGTLTRNEMEFFKMSVGGITYGTGVTEIERSAARRAGLEVPAMPAEQAAEAACWRAPAFNLYDKRLMDGAWACEPAPHLLRDFFRVLAVCHTVVPDGENMICG